ncbi:PE domain-containing protein [Nocardia sp. NPDC059180]|uniref:PE domain-containing protein n=1 Tax=Nocardia sp. NPDC059180 TaxID=3346761 RepID=UPI0036A80876
MPLPLHVSSEHLQSTSAAWSVDQQAFEASLVSGAAGTAPMPAACDDVSKTAAAAFTTYAQHFCGVTGDGAFKRGDGGEVLKPVAVNYTDNDIISGTTVSSYGSLSTF